MIFTIINDCFTCSLFIIVKICNETETKLATQMDPRKIKFVTSVLIKKITNSYSCRVQYPNWLVSDLNTGIVKRGCISLVSGLSQDPLYFTDWQ